LVTDKADKSKEKAGTYFIVLAEDPGELYCSKNQKEDEVLTYYWVLDSLSHGKVQPVEQYRIEIREQPKITN
jgi:hypothetical protein